MPHASSPADSLLQAYTNQIRVRVCGILVHEGTLLLAAHRGLLPDNQVFWSPPGGGWQLGETIRDGVVREFREETGLDVSVGRFLHLHEFLSDGLQAVELFFEVKARDITALRLGQDPEHPAENQLLTELAYLTPRQLTHLPPLQVHPVLRLLVNTDDIYIPRIDFK